MITLPDLNAGIHSPKNLPRRFSGAPRRFSSHNETEFQTFDIYRLRNSIEQNLRDPQVEGDTHFGIRNYRLVDPEQSVLSTVVDPTHVTVSGIYDIFVVQSNRPIGKIVVQAGTQCDDQDYFEGFVFKLDKPLQFIHRGKTPFEDYAVVDGTLPKINFQYSAQHIPRCPTFSRKAYDRTLGSVRTKLDCIRDEWYLKPQHAPVDVRTVPVREYTRLEKLLYRARTLLALPPSYQGFKL